MKTTSRKYDSLPTTFEALVQLFPPRVLRDRVDYENTQEMIDRLTSLPRLTPGQDDYLDTQGTLLHAYETEQFFIDTSDIDPLHCLRSLIEERGMNASDLGRVLGHRELGSAILHGRRQLSKANIVKLARYFSVSPALFLI